MIEVRQTEEFSNWFADLGDRVAKRAIAARIARVQNGNFGDQKAVGAGVSELRFFVGPGYRVYFTKRGNTVVILLCGGEKGSQDRDIATAKALAANL